MRRSLRGLTLAGVGLLLAAALVAHSDTPAASAPAVPSISLPPGTILPLELQDEANTKDTRKGDKLQLRLLYDVDDGNQIVLPAGSTVNATVIKVKKPGAGGSSGNITLEFNEVVLPDGTVLPLNAEVRSAGGLVIKPPKKNKKGTKVAGDDGGGGKSTAVLVATQAGQGALVGVLVGGAKGAAYGGAIGAGLGVLEVLLRKGPHLDLPAGTPFEIALKDELAVPEAEVAKFNPPPPAFPAPDLNAPQPPMTPPVYSASTQPDTGTSAVFSGSSDSSSSSSASVGSGPPIPDFPSGDTQTQTVAINSPIPTVPGLPPPPPPDVAGGDTDYKLRVNVRLVLVEAFVRDDRGTMISDLKGEDFRVFEDGREQQIRHFSRDELPLSVALVIDRSGSVIPYMDEIRSAAYETLQQLKPGDRVVLFTFAEDTDRLTDLTTDRRRVAERIARIRPGGGTNILDALHVANQYLSLAAPKDRRAIVLVSDNQATVRGVASQDRVIRQALESETVIYSVKTPGDAPPIMFRLGARVQGMGNVNKITRETGGEIIETESLGSIKAAMAAVVARLKTRYTIGYNSSNTASDGAFRKITVRLTDRFGFLDRDYAIHAKTGYYAPAQTVATQPQPTPSQ